MIPLVSCIMPTGDRPALMGEACSLFLDQDYPRKELLILDDGKRPYAGAVPRRANIYYEHRAGGRRSIGAKLNELVDLAAGEIIIRWDDDDLSHPQRITRQVEQLVFSGAEIAGYHSMLFADEDRRLAWYYRGASSYILGTSQCFFRRAFGTRRYPDSSLGEDYEFLRLFPVATRNTQDAAGNIIARVHAGNTASQQALGAMAMVPWADAEKMIAEARGMRVAA